MKIFFSTPKPSETTNPYITGLARRLAKVGVEIRFFAFRDVLMHHPHILHIHWPDGFTRGAGPFKTVVKRLLSALLFLKCQMTGAVVVQTMHNREPHDGASPLERRLLKAIDRRVDVRIYLNESADNDLERGLVILHPSYTRVTDRRRALEPNGKLLNFGMLRPYKGLETLINAFQQLGPDDGQVSLDLVGAPSPREYGDDLVVAASADDRITVDTGFLQEEALQRLILDADLVVLPYRHLYNSGAMLLALSLGVPVLASSSNSVASMQAELGMQWVQSYEGVLTPAVLDAALDRAQALRRTGQLPDLSRRSADDIAELHRSLYSALIRASSQLGARRKRSRILSGLSEVERQPFIRHSAWNDLAHRG